VSQIVASMREFGQAQLIVVDEAGEIIVGHGRVLAAKELGWKRVAVGIAVGWSDAQKRAYRIADNQIGLTSRWDDRLLRAEVGDLKLEDVDLSILAFDPGMLQALSMDFGKGDNDVLEAWNGMPEFNQPDSMSFRKIIMHFKDQKAVDAFAALLKFPISNNARYLWFPPESGERKVMSDKRYVSKK